MVESWVSCVTNYMKREKKKRRAQLGTANGYGVTMFTYIALHIGWAWSQELLSISSINGFSKWISLFGWLHQDLNMTSNAKFSYSYIAERKWLKKSTGVDVLAILIQKKSCKIPNLVKPIKLDLFTLSRGETMYHSSCCFSKLIKAEKVLIVTGILQ